jgi:adenosylcobinamide-GDP ribazoletransferase
MLPFWIALQFLSSLPVSLPRMPTPQESGRSLLFYPAAGALFGLILLGLNALLAGTPDLLRAAILLAAWVLLSGGLHLDGLADSADAWLGGFGDRERTLSIMKDPRSGPIAVVTLVMVLLLKFAALAAIIDTQASLALLLAPLVGRSAMLGLFLCTPYVRSGGLGQALADHLPRPAAQKTLVGCALGCVLVAGLSGLYALLASVACFFWLRHLMLRRLGGSTGDTAGAMLELLETVVLLTMVLS